MRPTLIAGSIIAALLVAGAAIAAEATMTSTPVTSTAADPAPPPAGPVARLDAAYFLRDPDPRGAAYWEAQRCDGRSPDPDGRAHRTGALSDDRLTRGGLMVGFSESPEFRARSGIGGDEVACGLERTFFGVEPVSLALSTDQIAAAFDLVADLGVGTVGVNASTWDELEPAPPVDGRPTYDWEVLDAIAREADRIGVQLQVTLQASSWWGTESTGGSMGSAGSSPVRPEHLDDFDAWVAALVGRYGGGPDTLLEGLSGPVLSMVMLGNEIEVPGHWAANGSATNPATAASYHDLLDRFAGVVEATAPGVSVMRASTNYGSTFDDDPDPATLAKRVAERGGPPGATFADFQTEAVDPARRFDLFATHPNHGVATLEHSADWLHDQLPAGVGLVAEDMRSTAVDTAFEERWPDRDGDGVDDVLELLRDGAESSGLAGAPAEVVEFRRMQAAIVAQKTTIAAQVGYDAALVSTMFDFGADYPMPDWWSTGLVNVAAEELRPAFHAYRELIDALVGAVPTGLHRPAPGVTVASFTRGGDRVAIAWADGDDRVDLTPWVGADASAVRLPSMPGEADVVPLATPVAATPVDEVPVVAVSSTG
ncbi:MAG: hypothetical protein ACLFV0_03615 [Nitriliruptoraceae bacterium]